MKRLKLLFALFLVSSAAKTTAQITVEPVFPTPTDAVTVTFNAAEGNAGLASETGDVYAHTGVITNLSTSTSDWKYVKAGWTTNVPECKLTRVNATTYTLTIPNIRTFYGVPAAENILKLAFVFRNATGTVTGKTADNGDIFYEVYSVGSALRTRIVSPTQTCSAVSSGTQLAFRGAASVASNLTLTDNGAVIASGTNVRELVQNVTITGAGQHILKFKAINGTQADSSVLTYVVPTAVITENPPAGAQLGGTLNAAGDSLTVLFQAPNKAYVYLVGSFNGWQATNDYLLKKSVDGKTWWLKVAVPVGQPVLYQYQVECLRVADPLSTLVLDPWNDRYIPQVTFANIPAYPTAFAAGAVSWVRPHTYTWRVNNFQRPSKTDLVIYELHLRDFIARHDYQTLMDTINYLKNLKVNAIELMPVCEFEGNESWGYNPSFHNALDKYYGTPEKFKEFVDLCHQNGIAVIVDVVYNHAFGQSPLVRMYWDGDRPASNSPFANRDAMHPFNVGYDLNHESEYTRNYVKHSLAYWLREYKIDGYRFDLSKGFTQTNSGSDVGAWGRYDQSRVNILQDYHNTVQSVSPGAYTILEHLGENGEETELANRGMMLWANANHNYNEATMGYSGNSLKWGSAKTRGWGDAKHDKHIAYMESHDEERLMYKNLQFGRQATNYDVRNLQTALRRIELASAFFYTIPGPRMLWQFGELGYDYSINYGCRVCNKPIQWDYFVNTDRNRLYKVTSNLIHLRTTQPAFEGLSYNENDLDAGYFKHFHVSSNDLNVTIIGNFDAAAGSMIPYFQNTGWWHDYLTGDSINVTSTTAQRNLLPGEYHVYTSKKLPVPPAGYINMSTGVKEFDAQVSAFQIYPNPSVSGVSTLGFSLRNAAEVRYEVLNLLGQVVQSQDLGMQYEGSQTVVLNTNIAKGTYLVRLTVGDATASRKLIVE